MLVVPLRLHPGDDLRHALDAALRTHGVEAGFVLSGIGSLSRARLRWAGADEAQAFDAPLEILTLAGSLGPDGSHLHASVADAAGRVWGGHVAPGCVVRT
ncbi:MAG: PPC domain-containing DNA-binding protein, partial [Leptothrix sp. (in: b-proteobacteria)]